jgi:predicted alpha/beta superfamily hydrolase
MTEKTHNKDTVRTKGLTIEPPPKESGPESLYRVVYMIDINAKDPQQAAGRVHVLMQDPESIPPVLDVLDSNGRRTRVDLSES